MLRHVTSQVSDAISESLTLCNNLRNRHRKRFTKWLICSNVCLVQVHLQASRTPARSAAAARATPGGAVLAYLGVVAVEVDEYERDPNDARRVHRESDELRLVEVLRQVARLDGVHRAHDDEEGNETERHRDCGGRLAARQPRPIAGGMNEHRVGAAVQCQRHADSDALGEDQNESDHHLCTDTRAHSMMPTGDNGRRQDAAKCLHVRPGVKWCSIYRRQIATEVTMPYFAAGVKRPKKKFQTINKCIKIYTMQAVVACRR
jgi:hypothetical protein